MIAVERKLIVGISLHGLMAKIKLKLHRPPGDSPARAGSPDDPDSPEDPFSYVGAPKKPRLPHLSASAAAPLE
jgi:hypothetical protein